MMGGRLWVESELGRGSRFCFLVRMEVLEKTMEPGILAASTSLPDERIPIVDDNQANRAITSPSRKLRILLAEDNRVNQAVASRHLAKLGHTLVIANNGQGAIDLLQQQTFDLVLMDVQMPELDGFLATKIIREHEKSTHTHIPIIAMTAHAMKGDRARCLAAGMDGYVTKPLNPEEVAAAILAVLHEVPEGGNTTNVDRDMATMKQVSEVPWNMSKTLEQLGGDVTLFQEVMDIFLAEAPKHLAALRLAVKERQAETVETAAHTLKGELGYLGMPEISQRASQIEEMGRAKNISGAATLLAQFETDINGLFTAIRSAKALAWNRT
jgi:two-component system sensor histidine kinase/response regulator